MNKAFFIRSFGALLIAVAPAVASAAGPATPAPAPAHSVQVGPIQAGKAPVTAPQTPNRQFNAWAKPGAAFPGGGGPLPSVRKQIGADAHASGVWQKGTSLRLRDNGNGTVTATLYAKSTFGGGPTPIAPTRLSYASATFHVNQVVEGKIVTPVKVDGTAWQRVMRAPAPPAKP